MIIYESMKSLSDELNGGTKSLIGFVGALWTILVYMLNKQSPKKKIPNEIIYEHKNINDLIIMVIKYIKIHISQQVNSGAQVIQIFDSWAGLVDEKHIGKFIYEPTKESLNFFGEKIIKGGIILLDDYGSLDFPGAKLATDNFLKNTKNILQEYCQKNGLGLPSYNQILKNGKKDYFSVFCKMNEHLYSIGYGKKLKLAEQDAALKLINQIGILDE